MLFKRALEYWNKNPRKYFYRKVLYFILFSLKIDTYPVRKIVLWVKTGCWIKRIGKNVSIVGFGNHIKLGKNLNIFNNCIFEFSDKSKFKIGNNCVFSYGVLIVCNKNIEIGNEVQIGEYTSIRDTTHDYSDFGVPMKYNTDVSKEIFIGNNVWIGRGCIISPGTIIEDGVVVGANSVVKGNLLANNIYAGSPVKLIKSRVL